MGIERFAKFELGDRGQGRLLRWTWWLVGLGFVLFLFVLVFTFLQEEWIGRKTREFISEKMEKRAGERKYSYSDAFYTLVADSGFKPEKEEAAASVEPAESAEPNEPEAEAAKGVEGLLGKLSERWPGAKESLQKGLEAARGLDIVQENEEAVKVYLKTFFEEKTRVILSRLVERYAGGEEVAAGDLVGMITALLEEALAERFSVSVLPRRWSVSVRMVEDRLGRQPEALGRIERLARSDYDEVIKKFIAELRLFSSLNLGVYLFLLVSIRFSGERSFCLIVPTFLMMLATLIACGIYVFGQDWFNTIIYERFWGWAYMTLVAVIFAFLIDIVFLKAIITRIILQILLEMLAGIAQVLGALVP